MKSKKKKHNEPGKKKVHKKHYRRNPEVTALAISPGKPFSLLMPAVIGAGGFFAADYIPIAIGMGTQPMYRLGIKVALAIGGAAILGKSKLAAAFSLGVGINVLNDVLKTYVFKTTAPTAGLGAFVPPKPKSLGYYELGSEHGFGAMSPYGSAMRHPFPS